MEALATRSMDIKSLEKDELLDLAAMLGARLAKSVETELALEIRVRGLERAVDAARKEGFWENRAKQLAMEAQGWEKSAEHSENLLQEARSELRNAKAQWEGHRKTLHNVLEDRDQAMVERDQAKQQAESLAELNKALASDHLKASAEWKAEREIFSANHRRLERELRETRATVLNEVSAMIPKSVEAERESCIGIIRDAALRRATAAESAALMEIVNVLKVKK